MVGVRQCKEVTLGDEKTRLEKKVGLIIVIISDYPCMIHASLTVTYSSHVTVSFIKILI